MGLAGEMRNVGVKASDVGYINLLTACSHAGLVEEGRKYFSQMVNVDGLETRIEHYGCMVDLLGRSGLLDVSFKCLYIGFRNHVEFLTTSSNSFITLMSFAE
ncbi:unnamed protein product [Eruca vesicaria subsp. sativa]|uniref:Pentatricopeptide repeat-containing protein n=1 Tax=Eruca vesicaria subsp. sativa TaxID=29727 RepID=A0ABC8IT72_ERUVS|nr:unnamed protein product [Eruca vesicaria subsp. sativa]